MPQSIRRVVTGHNAGGRSVFLSDGAVCLRPGDVLVQRGTNHAWSVRTEEPCLIAAILVSAEPV